MHAIHDTEGRFPPAVVYGKDGKPLLSWRVLILPHMNQDELYKQFKLDEPWDSANNLPLLAKMPPDYAPPPGKDLEGSAPSHRLSCVRRQRHRLRGARRSTHFTGFPRRHIE